MTWQEEMHTLTAFYISLEKPMQDPNPTTEYTAMIDADFQMMNAFKADLSDETSEPEYCSLEGQMPDPEDADTSFPPTCRFS
jgi:hypothetical protein